MNIYDIYSDYEYKYYGLYDATLCSTISEICSAKDINSFNYYHRMQILLRLHKQGMFLYYELCSLLSHEFNKKWFYINNYCFTRSFLFGSNPTNVTMNYMEFYNLNSSYDCYNHYYDYIHDYEYNIYCVQMFSVEKKCDCEFDLQLNMFKKNILDNTTIDQDSISIIWAYYHDPNPFKYLDRFCTNFNTYTHT